MPPKPRQPIVRSVKAPEALASLRAWLDTFDATTRERGAAYFKTGQVEDVWADADHFIEAVVLGQEAYEVTLFLTRGKWNSSCSCPMDVDCKHVYAASLAWIAEVESGAVDRQDLTPTALPEIPPPAWKTPFPPAPPPRAPSPPAPRSKKISFREQWSPVVAEKLGRPLTDAEGRQLGSLAALFAEFWQGHRTLYPDALLRHGFGDLVPRSAAVYLPVFQGWWDYATAPADPWALWQYLAYEAERTGHPMPEVFRPMTDTRGVHAALNESLVQQELATWRQAFAAEKASAPPSPAAAIAGLRARIAPDGSLSIETRASPDKPWKTPPQTWFRALGSAHPADFEHLPAAEAALGIALAAECHASYYNFIAKRPIPPEAVARLLRGSATRGAMVLPDDRPFAIEPEPLVREATLSATARDRLELRLVTPDGRDATTARLIVPRPEALYLFEKRVWRGPPPMPAARLPTAALGDTRIMSHLRATGLRLPASLEIKIRRVTLRPRLRCWLDEPENAYMAQHFRAELAARADDPPCEQHWRGVGGWQWIKGGAPPPRPADGALLEFDLAAAQAVSARFADFRLGWNEWSGAWTRPNAKNFPEEFTAWHASLPAGLDVELSPELAGLLGPPLRAHVDFSAVPANSGHDWFDLTIALRIEDTTLTPEEIALLLKARGKWVRLPRQGWKRLELGLGAEAGDAAAAALDRLGLGADDVLAAGKPTTHRLHALQLAGEAAAFEARDAKLAAGLRERAATLAALPPPALPAGLRATLRPYQEEGFHFLAHLSAHGFGGVLADDMGLGKTVQTLAWLLHLSASYDPRDPVPTVGLQKTERRPPAAAPFRALVVCPKSVTHGWLAETERFAPGLNAVPFTPALVRMAASAVEGGLLVANYTQLRLHAAWFQAGAWDVVVLDEGQFIKNPSSQIAMVARALPSRHRLVLTGTPVENRLTDLWSLFAFSQPGLLGTQAAFKRQYPAVEPDALARLRRRVNHFLLRRTKAQAAPDLPSRTEDDLVVELEPQQRALYDAELKRARAQLLGVETARALDKVRFNVLASLLRLRQICCHPALVDPAHAELPSAKLDALLERLEELREEGHQVLVFSQFVAMLEIIRERLIATDIGHLILTGATENRAALVEEFQRDRSKTVFLLSLKAAGFGLNLTAASYAILYDPWWNPAVEAQAIDRTHRIGQTRPVIAYRLLAAGTVEEKIRALQKEKATLAAAVVQEESLASVMDLDSLRQILA
ncbi:MAG: DEAD/DEAH box helicase [Opitutaceae bacterium]